MGFFSKLSTFFGGVRPAPVTKPNGGDGVVAFGGFLPTNESSPALIGSRKWVTYGNAYHTAIVATALRYTLGLLSGTNWHAEPNESGHPDVLRGVEVVEQGLLKAPMHRPWSAVVRKQALYRFVGFGLHEWTVRTRADGLIVFADLAHRPQHTIDRWDKTSEQEPWHAVGQLTRNGNRYEIPRERLFYAVDDTLTDSPEGIGLLRHVVELVRRLGVLEGLEGLAYETDIRGMPIGRAPIAELRRTAAGLPNIGNDTAKIDAFVNDRLRTLHNAVVNVIKSPDRLQHLLLDSDTYHGADPNNITSIQKWGLELLRGEASGVEAVAAAIGRIQLEIARVLGVEFAMVGGLDTAGSYGMHADKTDMLAVSLQTTLTELAGFATQDLARPLVALNGLDPETCTPTLVAEPISTESIMTVVQALSTLAMAGLAPNDPARGVIRKRLRLPPEPELTAEQMGVGGPPDEALGEEDVPLDDEEDVPLEEEAPPDPAGAPDQEAA